MKELSPKARAMLDALQTIDSPAAEVEARAWSAVVGRTAAGDLGPSVPADPIAPATGAAWLGKPVLWIVGAVAIASGVAIAVTRDEVPVDPPKVEPAAVIDDATVAAVPPSIPPPPQPAVAPPPDEEPELVPEPTKPVRTRTKAEAPKAPPKTAPAPIDGPDALEQEMRLMSEARAALGAGDASRAITLLQRHAKQFPKGAFVLEREVSWITALCALGRTDAARQRADAFLKRHGSHALAAKVRASCGGTP